MCATFAPDTTAHRAIRVETLDCPPKTGILIVPRGPAAAIGRVSCVWTDYYPVDLRSLTSGSRVRFYSLRGPACRTYVGALERLGVLINEQEAQESNT